MCRSRYKKVKSLFEDTPIYSKSRPVGTQTDSASTSTETQTFPALPIMKEM